MAITASCNNNYILECNRATCLGGHAVSWIFFYAQTTDPGDSCKYTL